MRTARAALLAFCALVAAPNPAPAADTLVLDGATVLPVAGSPIPSARIVIRDGRFAALGPASEVAIPADAEVRDLTGTTILPGLIDTHTHLGLAARPAVPAHNDTNEATDPLQSGLRALDSIWPDDPGIRLALAGGVTTANIMPGSANPVGGQTAYVKLRGQTVDEMLVRKEGVQGGLKMANGENPKRVYGEKKKAPATRMAVAALQRELFVRAQEYQRKWNDYRAKAERDKNASAPERDLDLEPIVEVLEGRRTVHYHAHRADDIMTALRLRDEFHFDLVLQHATEGYRVADEIARRGVPVSIIVLDSPGGKHETTNTRLDNAAILARAGVRVAIHTDDPVTPSRLFLRTAALAVRGGMSEAGALRAVTLEAARILGIDDRVGSIEVGKDADLVVLSGPPFSVYTHVLETYIDGQRVFDRSEPTQRHYATGGFGVGDRYPALEAAP